MTITIIIMNMQNNLFKIEFSHHSVTDLQPVPEHRSWTPWIFANLMKFQKKVKLPERFELPDKRGFELLETRRADSFLLPGQPPLIN